MITSYKKLWKILIDHNMKKKDLVEQTGISWATVTKMAKGEDVSMEALRKVCMLFNCNIGDIVEFEREAQ